MTEQQLRNLGLRLSAEEQSLLFKVAMVTATAEEQRRHTELVGIIREIEARLHRMGGDGAGLFPTPIG